MTEKRECEKEGDRQRARESTMSDQANQISSILKCSFVAGNSGKAGLQQQKRLGKNGIKSKLGSVIVI